MLEDLLCCPPIWRPVNSLNIWNFLWLASLTSCTEAKSLYTSTFCNAQAPKMAENHERSV